MSERCYVYFATQPDNGFIKIGCSAMPEIRMSRIKDVTKSETLLIKKWSYPDRKTALSVERHLHQQFKSSCVYGEWFYGIQIPKHKVLFDSIRANVTGDSLQERIINTRRASGLTQEDLSKATGFSQVKICRIESGKHHLTVDEAQLIGGVFRVSLDELVGFAA